MTFTDECNCLSSPNALYGPCEACSRQREDVEILDHYYHADTGEASDLEDPNRIRVPLAQLRPMPVTQELTNNASH